MSSKKEFVNELNKSEVDKIIAQRAQAEALSDAEAKGMQKGIEKAHTEATLDFETPGDLENWLKKYD